MYLYFKSSSSNFMLLKLVKEQVHMWIRCFSWETLENLYFPVDLKDISRGTKVYLQHKPAYEALKQVVLCSSSSATTCICVAFSSSLNFSMPHTFTYFIKKK